MSDQAQQPNGEAQADLAGLQAPEGRQLLQIQATMFTIDAPYKEGYQLKPNEASAMNQLLAENIRNNMASTVRNFKLKIAGWTEDQIKAGKAEQMGPVVESTQLSTEQMADLQGQLDEYVKTYEFGLRSGRARLTPFDKEVDNIVSNMLDTALKSKGYSPSKMMKEERSKYDALYNRIWNANKAAIEQEATKRLQANQAFMGGAAVDLSEPTSEELTAPATAPSTEAGAAAAS
jgi:hypothetical protein